MDNITVIEFSFARKHFKIINSISLSETFSHQSSFLPLYLLAGFSSFKAWVHLDWALMQVTTFEKRKLNRKRRKMIKIRRKRFERGKGEKRKKENFLRQIRIGHRALLSDQIPLYISLKISLFTKTTPAFLWYYKKGPQLTTKLQNIPCVIK